MNSTTTPIIFYGAGDYARRNLHRWVSSEGLVPVCFADKNTDKHYTDLASDENENLKYKILPLDTADVLAPILDACDWDFAQLQINYYDWTAQRAKDSYTVPDP